MRGDKEGPQKLFSASQNTHRIIFIMGLYVVEANANFVKNKSKTFSFLFLAWEVDILTAPGLFEAMVDKLPFSTMYLLWLE